MNDHFGRHMSQGLQSGQSQIQGTSMSPSTAPFYFIFMLFRGVRWVATPSTQSQIEHFDIW